MSFKSNNTQQLTLNDSFINQTPRMLPPASRPNTPVNFIIGALMLKENNNLNDDELLESLCCDIRYQFAPHTTHYQEQPVSDRTFSRFRERVYHYELETGKNLLEDEMMHLAEVYQAYMQLNSNVKRMDSLMIYFSCSTVLAMMK